MSRVLIPALNEQERLPALFEALAKQQSPVEPIVIDNWSQDATAEIAESCGATILREEEPGQMRAIQKGIKFILDNYQDSEAIFIIDADTKPLKSWSSAHLRHARRPGQYNNLQYGRVHHAYPWTVEGTVVRVGRATYIDSAEFWRRFQSKPPRAKGSNTCLVNPDKTLLESTLSIPNYGLGNDIALRDHILARGGSARYLYDIRASVVSSGDRYPTLQSALKRMVTPRKGQIDAYKEDFGKFDTYPNLEL
ncbi:MAG: glycosyltransferase family A protein [Patescibacteria group bacterium]